MFAARNALGLLLPGWVLLQHVAGKPIIRIAGSSTVEPVALAWSNHTSDLYDFTDSSRNASTCVVGSITRSTVCGGGSSTGASRVCIGRGSRDHVDIGTMSRDWTEPKEGMRLDDGYTIECAATKLRVTQMIVGIDGVAVVVLKGGTAHNCLTNPTMGGLTLAQLRWIYTTWTDEQLQRDGVDVDSVAPNNNHNGIKEWSDFSAECDRAAIQPYGEGNLSGTASFFGEHVFCLSCFSGTNPIREGFSPCSDDINDQAGQAVAGRSSEDIRTWLTANRPPNCYMHNEDDDIILRWISSDREGIAYFGFAYYTVNSATLTVARIADDALQGIGNSTEAAVAPDVYSITDGSYSVFRRSLFMNVDNEAWPLVQGYMNYGYSKQGQAQVAVVGYITINVAILAKMVTRTREGGNSKADYVSVAPSNCPIGYELFQNPYRNVFGTMKVNYTCQACQKGYSKRDDHASPCDKCASGSYTDRIGQSACKFCSPGTSARAGDWNCTNCSINTFAPMPASGLCSVCEAGLYTPSTGKTECDRCDLGRYRTVNDSACVRCPPGMTTEFLAATVKEDCECAPGSFKVHGGAWNGRCDDCPKGMSCKFGSQFDNFAIWSPDNPVRIPMLNLNYWSASAQPLDVYLCSIKEQVCPGGAPGSCKGGRVGTVCAVCPDGQTWKKSACVPCDGGFTVLGIFFPVICCAAIAASYYLSNSPLTSNTSVIGAITIVSSKVLTIAQLLGMFANLNVSWPIRVRNVFDALAFSMASPNSVSFECIIGQSAVVQYSTRCLMPAVLLALVVFMHTGSSAVARLARCFKRTFRKWDYNKTVNTAGQILQTVFIALAGIMVVPLQCYLHPNGKSSLTEFPQVLCWRSSDHTTMVVLGAAVAFLFVIPYVAFCLFGTYVVVKPSGLTTTKGDMLQGVRDMMRYRFLLFRFRPDMWWWGNVFLARQLALVFAPSVPSETPHGQIVYVVGILISYGLAQAHYWPWKAPEFNCLDLFITGCLVMIIATSTAFLAAPDSLDAYILVMMFFIFILFSGTLLLIASIVMYAVRGRQMGPSASFGRESVNSTSVAKEFYDLCSIVADLGLEGCDVTVADMNIYDKMLLIKCVACYQASNPEACPSGKLATRRLAGISRSNPGSRGSSGAKWWDAEFRSSSAELSADFGHEVPSSSGGAKKGCRCQGCGRLIGIKTAKTQRLASLRGMTASKTSVGSFGSNKDIFSEDVLQEAL